MRRKLDPIQLKQLIEVEQLTQAAIAVRLECSQSCVERTCKRLALHTQRSGPRSGEKHTNWKGGRKKVGNYWYRWTNTHPHRTKGNYILEHRLVMEESIGRHLLPGEVVHHKNGDPEDNRLENLQLFGSNTEHLAYELIGRIPAWTDEGREQILKAVRQIPRRKSLRSDGE